MQFNELNIIDPILKALEAEGYTEPTPIQEKAIPPLLTGSDLLGCAQTGTGKTAAFAIPILQTLTLQNAAQKSQRVIRALIVAPTRELAIQIGECFDAYAANLTLKTLVIFGGVGQKPQTNALQKGVDILVATPGRLLDLINQGYIRLNHVSLFVLDEADRMLDMGMLPDVKRILRYLPSKRQTMFFSATMPAEIKKLADTMLQDPLEIEITPPKAPIDIIEQGVCFVDKENKTKLLIYFLDNIDYDSVLVFTKTKHGADKVERDLLRHGFKAAAIHGNKSQMNRQAALNAFKERKIRILVATDIAARGLDIEELSHVVNYNLPDVPETYIHRIGRTGRAGLGGVAVSFCDAEEKGLLSDIQLMIGRHLPVGEDHPYPMMNPDAAKKPKASVPGRVVQGSYSRYGKIQVQKKVPDIKTNDKRR